MTPIPAPPELSADLRPSKASTDGIERISTGIEGLDDILLGGLPAGYLYLLEGDPGTGKTTLALQFLLQGIRNGEKTLFVTLSESPEELVHTLRSHGWPTDSLLISEIAPPDEDLKPEAQYTVFHPSEVELADTIAAIVNQVNAVNPSRVIFDSLSELRMLARDPLKYRRQILGLKRHLSGRHCTAILIDDYTAERGNDLQLQSIAHGVIEMQSISRDYGVNRNRLQIRKLRGSPFRGGFHDYIIRTGGLHVFPRLIASEHKPGFTHTLVCSGLDQLDDLLGGGIDAGTSTLLAGPAGSGKSTIAFRYALSAAQRGEKAMVFTFDESIETLITRVSKLGMDPSAQVESGRLEMQQIDPAELAPGEFVSRVRTLVDRDNLSLLVIDSINGLLNAMPHEQFLAMQLHELFSYLGQQGIATIITLAHRGVIGAEMSSPIDVSYLADTIILFRYYEQAGEIRQALSVIKKRSGSHERTIRELRFHHGAVHVGDPLVNFEGILTGVPHLLFPAASEGDLI